MRYCDEACQRADWSRHRPDCRAWRRSDADAAVVAAGGCPLGDLEAQAQAVDEWRTLGVPLAELRAAAEAGNLAAQFVFGAWLDQGVNGAPLDQPEAARWWRRAAAGNLAHAQAQLGLMFEWGRGGLGVDLVEAARLYRRAAAQGLAKAQSFLGVCYRDGKGVPLNLAESVRLFRLGAEQGDDSAQVHLSGAFLSGDGVERDYAAAMMWARRAADQGNPSGEHTVGMLHRNAKGVPRDKRAAAYWYARAAAGGCETAKSNLLLLSYEGVPEAAAALAQLGITEPQRSAADAAIIAAGRCPLGDLAAQQAAIASWFATGHGRNILEAAGKGNLAAQCAYGKMFYPKGPNNDLPQALSWLRRAADGNVADAQAGLGAMCFLGEGGLAADAAQGAALYGLAAAQGHPTAQLALGRCYSSGDGVPLDLEAAARQFRLSAEQGNADAQAALAGAYLDGDGLLQDFAAAKTWARRAADQGSAAADFIIGALYANGQGVPRDLRAATAWFARSAARGDERAMEVLLELAADGVPEAVAAARRLRLAPP